MEKINFWIAGFIVGALSTYIFFPQEIAETEASKKCEELSGNFRVDYKYEWGENFKTKPIFKCIKSEEILFKTD